MGDMACAASPMHNSPGRNQRLKRSTATVSNLMSSSRVLVPLGLAETEPAGPTPGETREAPVAEARQPLPLGIT